MTVQAPSSSLSRSTEIIGISAGLLTALIWGGYLSSSRAGVVAGLSGMDIAFIRICVASLLLAPVAFFQLRSGQANFRWGHILVLTVLVGPPFVLISAGGYVYAPLAHGAILVPAVLTIGGIVFARLLLNDRISIQALAGVGVILFGLLFVAGSAFYDMSASFLIGDLMFVVGGLMWAMAASLQKKWGLKPVEIAAFVSVLGALFFVPYFLATQSLDSIHALSMEMFIFLVIVQGVLSGVVALFAFTKSVQILGAARASIFPALVPALAVLIGIPVTGEIPTFYQALGLVVVTTGLMIAVLRSR